MNFLNNNKVKLEFDESDARDIWIVSKIFASFASRFIQKIHEIHVQISAVPEPKIVSGPTALQPYASDVCIRFQD
jgi:hypothetical protein